MVTKTMFANFSIKDISDFTKGPLGSFAPLSYLSLQLSCADTCQIWTWYSLGNSILCNYVKAQKITELREQVPLTHCSPVMHIWISKLTIIGSDNGLSPVGYQAIIWTNVVSLSIGPVGTNFNQLVFKIQTFSFTKMHLKMSGKWRPFCLSLNVLTPHQTVSGIILGLHPANKRQRYKVTLSLIGWAQT